MSMVTVDMLSILDSARDAAMDKTVMVVFWVTMSPDYVC